MVREKVMRRPEYREVIYDEKHWGILRALRNKAIRILKPFYQAGIEAIVHGSIARGDVWEGSDIDIFIPFIVPSYRVEYILESSGYTIYSRYIAIATPSSTPKAYIVLDPEEKIVVSFPLLKPSMRELEFYKFGGLLDLNGLLKDRRVPGVDKRLVLIEPTEKGHRESPVIGREDEVASILGISIDTVLERVRVLTRRDEIGRTDVFVKYELSPDESFEEALIKISERNPLVRRLLKERGYI
jgi:predicted nucleotidyltransferase